jgi:hypothetical protein
MPYLSNILNQNSTYQNISGWVSSNAADRNRFHAQILPALQSMRDAHQPSVGSGASITPAGSFAGSSAFRGGVLTNDGSIFFVPASSTTARIYDPKTNTLSTPAGTYPGSSAHAGSRLLPDGRVFSLPLNSTVARIYDPSTDTLSTPTGSYPGSVAYRGVVLMNNGQVFCVPFSATTARVALFSNNIISSQLLTSSYLNKI